MIRTQKRFSLLTVCFLHTEVVLSLWEHGSHCVIGLNQWTIAMLPVGNMPWYALPRSAFWVFCFALAWRASMSRVWRPNPSVRMWSHWCAIRLGGYWMVRRCCRISSIRYAELLPPTSSRTISVPMHSSISGCSIWYCMPACSWWWVKCVIWLVWRWLCLCPWSLERSPLISFRSCAW